MKSLFCFLNKRGVAIKVIMTLKVKFKCSPWVLGTISWQYANNLYQNMFYIGSLLVSLRKVHVVFQEIRPINMILDGFRGKLGQKIVISSKQNGNVKMLFSEWIQMCMVIICKWIYGLICELKGSKTKVWSWYEYNIHYLHVSPLVCMLCQPSLEHSHCVNPQYSLWSRNIKPWGLEMEGGNGGEG